VEPSITQLLKDVPIFMEAQVSLPCSQKPIHSYILEVRLNPVNTTQFYISTAQCTNYTQMVSSGMLRRVALVRTDVSEEHGQGENNQRAVILRSVRQLVVPADDVPSSLIFPALMTEAINSYDTSVLTRGTRRHIPRSSSSSEVKTFAGFCGHVEPKSPSVH
jgi:hypothetical protein